MPKKRTKAAPQRRIGGRSARVIASVHAAVLEELATVGYQRLCIADIARRAQVHETSIYRRWPTKAQLVSDAITRNALEAVPVPDTGSFERDLMTMMRRVLRRLDTPLGAAISRVVAGQDEELAELRRVYWTSRKAEMARLINRAKERGELSDWIEPATVFDMVVGPVLLRRTAGEPVTNSFFRSLVNRVIAALKSERA